MRVCVCCYLYIEHLWMWGCSIEEEAQSPCVCLRFRLIATFAWLVFVSASRSLRLVSVLSWSPVQIAKAHRAKLIDAQEQQSGRRMRWAGKRSGGFASLSLLRPASQCPAKMFGQRWAGAYPRSGAASARAPARRARRWRGAAGPRRWRHRRRDSRRLPLCVHCGARWLAGVRLTQRLRHACVFPAPRAPLRPAEGKKGKKGKKGNNCGS